MKSCPQCRFRVPGDGPKCPECGYLFDETLSGDTAVLARDDEKPTSIHPTESADGARFAAGTMLAGRYRIVTLLGRGGMGEVYKAEDLTLKQIVALKFLPEVLARDGAVLARFQNEVRITRQISHPNVCRVYDIGEAEGMHFLSMEFIDGEDLSNLLRRIGRLPGDKANEIARQICAGVAAAHDMGVLHRDLKPANIMIDGRGKARVTDFGVSVVAKEVTGADAASGTPAYMAPEQLTGKEVTRKSDIYSLGLVLYELFTGKRVYDSDNILELIQLHENSTPTSPSSHIQNIDPLVERVILRCLEKEPNKRPTSALQVAAALPGGDPLAAALAAGETPSPEMVAASGEKTGLRPAVAVALLASVIVGLVTLAFLGNKVNWGAQLLYKSSPNTLSHKARDIINRLGYSDPPIDTAYGFTPYRAFRIWVDENTETSDRWTQYTRSRPGPIYFWYRQSNRYLESTQYRNVGWVTEWDPPNGPGLVSVNLDPAGNLTEFIAVPPQIDTTIESASPPDWLALFAAAGLDQTMFTPVEPIWRPDTMADARAAWSGTYPDQPDIPMRIEAASYRGKPVFFAVWGPWARIWQEGTIGPSTGQQIQAMMSLILLIVVLAGALLMVRYNLRHGRGDRRGATRVAAFVFAVSWLGWLFGARHTPTQEEVPHFWLMGIAPALLAGGAFWLLYIALEPHVRRRLPHTLVSWSRVLSGDLRDPLVGRDILAGIFFGVVVTLFDWLENMTRLRLGGLPTAGLGWFSDVQYLIAQGFLNGLTGAILIELFLFFVLFLLRLITRRQWLAATLFFLVGLAQAVLGSDDREIAFIFACLQVGLWVFITLRFGLLTMVVTVYAGYLLNGAPLTTDFSAWYATNTFVVLGAILALAAFAFHSSLGGQKLFAGNLLDE